MARISKSPQIRKNEILDAAEKLFIANGYDRTSVNDIVKSIGVAQGTFYYHFESKEAVVEALADRYINMLFENFSGITADRNMSCLLKVEAIGRRFLNINEGNIFIMDFVHREKNAVLHQKMALKAFNVFTPVIERLLEEGVEKGEFRITYGQETAVMLIMTIQFLHEFAAFNADKKALSRHKKAVADIVERLLGTAGGSIDLDRRNR